MIGHGNIVKKTITFMGVSKQGWCACHSYNLKMMASYAVPLSNTLNFRLRLRRAENCHFLYGAVTSQEKNS